MTDYRLKKLQEEVARLLNRANAMVEKKLMYTDDENGTIGTSYAQQSMPTNDAMTNEHDSVRNPDKSSDL